MLLVLLSCGCRLLLVSSERIQAKPADPKELAPYAGYSRMLNW
jgi:hypothetical protein